ncbi:MAG: hypothetical protein AAFV85_12585 [Cyanobacteria bacterium J06634_6]
MREFSEAAIAALIADWEDNTDINGGFYRQDSTQTLYIYEDRDGWHLQIYKTEKAEQIADFLLTKIAYPA